MRLTSITATVTVRGTDDRNATAIAATISAAMASALASASKPA